MTTATLVRQRRALRFLLLSTLVLILVPASDAFAGKLLVTGHDWDLHCSGGQQCHYTKVGVKFVRGDSNKKVLVVDQPNSDVDVALDNAFSPGFPRKIVAPTSAEWKTLNLTPSKFSAILIASDASCGGCDLNQLGLQDSVAINKRKGAIKRYFNQGGGLMVGAGASHGDGNAADDIYYDFVPIPVGGAAVSPPFCLTNLGIKLGFQDQTCPDPSQRSGTQDDINCCPTHNSFKLPPKGSALRVAESDGSGSAETLIAKGVIRGGEIVANEKKLALTVDPKRAREDEFTCFKFKVTSKGERVKGATVRFGGQRDKTNRRGKATICRAFGKPGQKRARATKRGFERARATVRIIPKEPSTCPKLARC